MAHPTDLAPPGPVPYPDTGLGRGWEPTVLTTATVILLSFGLVTLYSGSSFLAQRQALPDYHFVLRQAAGAAAGLAVMVVCARIPYRWWRTAAWPLLLACWILLLLTILPWTEGIAPEWNGARRWLQLGVTFQPAEPAKLAVVIWTAALAVKKRESFSSLSRGLLPFLLIWAAVAVPILLQPDLSTAFIVLALGALVVFAAGARIGHFIFLGLVVTPLLARQLDVGFRADRISTFLRPEMDPAGAGFQVRQSLISLGSGGIAGVGFGEGRQKFGFLPEPHNDFIFALIGEEWGFLGVVGIMALYLTLVLVGFRIAQRAADLFGQLLAMGMTSLIALQAMLHMSVSLGLVPPTGLSLPLISYGRSNLVITLAAVGILMAVARQGAGGRVARG